MSGRLLRPSAYVSGPCFRGRISMRLKWSVLIHSFQVILYIKAPWPTQVNQLEWPNIYPLDQRAWTLQEKVLSPRIIQFNEDEIHWLFRRGSASEFRPEISIDTDRLIRLSNLVVGLSQMPNSDTLGEGIPCPPPSRSISRQSQSWTTRSVS